MLHLLAYKETRKYVRVFTKRELESVIREVVDPFFLIVSANPEVAGRLAGGAVPDWLHPELTKKTFKFLTNSLHALEEELLLLGRELHEQGACMGEINTYYYIWADLIRDWLESRGEYDMEYWKLKLLSAFVLVAMGPVETVPCAGERHPGRLPDAEEVVGALLFLERRGTPEPALLEELEQLEGRMDAALNSGGELSRAVVESAMELFTSYARFIRELEEFPEIAAFFHSLLTVMDMDPAWMDSRSKKHIKIILESVTEDLGRWRQGVFLQKNAADIHFLDRSLISSCFQLENLLGRDLDTEVVGEVELF